MGVAQRSPTCTLSVVVDPARAAHDIAAKAVVPTVVSGERPVWIAEEVKTKILIGHHRALSPHHAAQDLS